MGKLSHYLKLDQVGADDDADLELSLPCRSLSMYPYLQISSSFTFWINVSCIAVAATRWSKLQNLQGRTVLVP